MSHSIDSVDRNETVTREHNYCHKLQLHERAQKSLTLHRVKNSYTVGQYLEDGYLFGIAGILL